MKRYAEYQLSRSQLLWLFQQVQDVAKIDQLVGLSIASVQFNFTAFLASFIKSKTAPLVNVSISR